MCLPLPDSSIPITHPLYMSISRTDPFMGFPDEDAQGVVEHGPLLVLNPLPKDMINSFPVREVGGQITPRAATFGEIEDGIQDSPPVQRWAAALGGLGEHRLEVSPLGGGQIGVVVGDFHRLTGATANESHPNRQSNQAFCAFFCSRVFQKNTAEFFFRQALRSLIPGADAGMATAARRNGGEE
jgi:hypothetical protein